MTDIVVYMTIKKTKVRDAGGGERRRDRYREGEHVREGDAGSGVCVCLLTKSLKSMAVLMNISQGKLVQSSAGTDSLTANVIEHLFKGSS